MRGGKGGGRQEERRPPASQRVPKHHPTQKFTPHYTHTQQNKPRQPNTTHNKKGSFGNVYAFGQNLVNSMDTSFFARARGRAPDDPDVQVARLVDAAERGEQYLIEYTVHKPALEAQPRHLLSAVALGFNGRYNRLITVTAQCREGQVGAYVPLFREVLGSFTPPAKVA